MVIFHSYVSWPEGSFRAQLVIQPPAKCQEAEADCELKLPAGQSWQLLCPDGRIMGS
jgi:hypothetical protein